MRGEQGSVSVALFLPPHCLFSLWFVVVYFITADWSDRATSELKQRREPLFLSIFNCHVKADSGFSLCPFSQLIEVERKKRYFRRLMEIVCRLLLEFPFYILFGCHEGSEH